MLKKAIVFQIVFSIFCAYAQSSDHFSDLQVTSSRYERDAEFSSTEEKIEDRWRVFQNGRRFEPFSVGKSDSVLKEEFETIRSTRNDIWATSGYEFAYHLILADLIRAPGCVAFAYNNTVPYYNASTMRLRDRFYIACEGPRSKDVPSFFTLLNTYGVTHLVRLTDAYEGTTKKCHPYWEGLLSASADGKTYLNISTENGVHSIQAFDMAYWQDNQGVDPEQLLKIVLQVREELAQTPGGLLTVHCSAGVGRTGTFLAALAIVDVIDRNLPLSIEEIVYRLSLQRIHSVAKFSQYITLHRLAENYLRDNE